MDIVMQSKTPRAGRPTAAPSDSKSTMSIRATGSLKQRLVAAAAKNDQSLSQEAENRLEKSFYGEGERMLTLDTLRSPQLAGLISLMFVVMKRAIEEGHLHSTLPEEGGAIRTVDWQAMDWLADPYAFDQMAQAAFAILEIFRPAGDAGEFASGDSPKGDYLRWLGTALAYSIMRELLASPKGEHDNGLVEALRDDLSRHLASVSLPNSPNALIEKLKKRAEAIVAAASLVRAEPAATAEMIEAGQSLVDAARKRTGQKRTATEK